MNAQVNTKFDNPLTLAQDYGKTLFELASALNQKATDGEQAREAGKAVTNTVTAKLKEFALITAKDGVPVEAARAALNIALTGFMVKEGTRKASGNHFAGFRAMLASDKVDAVAFKKATVREAQDFIASDESKAKNAAKREWQQHTKDWTAVQWHTFLLEQGVRIEGQTDNSTAEDEEEAISEDEQAEIEEAMAAAHAAAPRTGTNG